ncbi:receptor-like protein 12 [Cinnamomum micranthum f. kanehirae]|uniref:Receptor-like protein 12 n=1 Tax=Cinnamomum micranthum f. kanehirae TaxID=337451 RepID=A0A3S3MUA2_9MAGN|nr:receptor-like protein 12 [Cinnamomum micranthum f. kanehirae]
MLMRGINSELKLLYPSKFTAINGTISPSLFTLVHLKYLDLSFNNFHFSKIPGQFANLKSLIYLNLSNSMFSDSITTQFTNLSSLQLLDLSCATEIPDFSSMSYSLSNLKPSFDSRFSYNPNGHLACMNLKWLQGLLNLRVLMLDGVDLSQYLSICSYQLGRDPIISA